MDFEEWYDNRIWGNEDFKEACWAAWDAAAEAEREECANVCESFRYEERERRLEVASREAEGTGDELTILRNWSECRLWNAAHERSAAAIRERYNA